MKITINIEQHGATPEYVARLFDTNGDIRTAFSSPTWGAVINWVYMARHDYQVSQVVYPA